VNEAQAFILRALALPLDQQRDALWPAYAAVYGAYGNDWELNTAPIHEDWEIVFAGSRKIPGLGEMRGREGYIREQTAMLEHLNVERVQLDDLRPLGNDRVVAFIRFVIRAGDGTIDQQALDHHEFRDGLVVRQTVWFDREEGLRELGL
jgi:hypothetical protein